MRSVNGGQPGQWVEIVKNPDRGLLGIALRDTAVAGGQPVFIIELNQRQTQALIGDLLEVYEALYATPFAPVEPLDDTQRV